MPDHHGDVRLRVALAGADPVLDGAVWAVDVPFHVTGPLEVGTVMGMSDFGLPLGRYQLVFSGQPGDANLAFVLDLIFRPSDMPAFRILRAGGPVTGAIVLRNIENPAI